MSIAIGGNSASKIYLGCYEVSKIYFGSDLVYGGQSPVLPYDAEVEYIASSGNQYIDTGVTTSERTNYIVDINVLSTEGSSTIIGARNGDPDNPSGLSDYRLSVWVNGSGQIALNDKSYDSGWKNASLLGSRYRVSVNHRTLFKDDTQIVYSTQGVYSSYSDSLTYGLLRCHGSNQWAVRSDRPVSSNVYGSVINDGIEQKRNYIPVRKGQIGYLYDTISGELFGSITSDAFSVGRDIVSITATFSTSKTIYTCDSLDYLKRFLIVTAHYSDNSTSLLTPECCSIEGTLSVGSNTLVVKYGRHETTISVNNVADGVLSFYHYDFWYRTIDNNYPYWTVSINNNKRFVYWNYDKRISGGKTYRFIAETNTSTAYFGYQFYNQNVIDAVEQHTARTSTNIYDTGWQSQDVTLAIPQQVNNLDIKGLTISCKYNSAGGNFNNGFYLDRLVIIDMT